MPRGKTSRRTRLPPYRFECFIELGSWADAISAYGVWFLWFRPVHAHGFADYYGTDCIIVFTSRTARERAFFLQKHPAFQWLHVPLHLSLVSADRLAEFVRSSKLEVDEFYTPGRGVFSWPSLPVPDRWQAAFFKEDAVPEALVRQIQSGVQQQAAVELSDEPALPGEHAAAAQRPAELGPLRRPGHPRGTHWRGSPHWTQESFKL